MTKTYTIKHVIFALREEYKKIEKELEDLKQYITKAKNVDDYYFHIASRTAEILLIIERKKFLLDKILMLLKSSPDFQIFNIIDNNIKNNYGSVKWKENCSIINKQKLEEKIDLIKKSDYFNNLFVGYIKCNENPKTSLLIQHSSVDISHGLEVYPHLYYYSKSDTLSISNKDKIIKPDDLLKLLNLTINSDTLNDYLLKILDNYEEKEIIIEDNFKKKHARLKIIEEPKKLILVPKTQ